MRRRQFIRFVGGAMAAWPLVARAQKPRGQTRLIGVVVPFSKTDPEIQPLLAAFNQRLQELGWTEGHDVRLEYRFTSGDSEQIRPAAAELVGLAPDIILAHGASTVGPLLQLTRTIPIVFPAVFDPVGAGVVDSISGANTTNTVALSATRTSKANSRGQCPLSTAKRTCRVALHMSAFDPKRTLGPMRTQCPGFLALNSLGCVGLLGGK